MLSREDALDRPCPQKQAGRAGVGVFSSFPLTFRSFCRISSDPRGYILQYSQKDLKCLGVCVKVVTVE